MSAFSNGFGFLRILGKIDMQTAHACFRAHWNGITRPSEATLHSRSAVVMHFTRKANSETIWSIAPCYFQAVLNLGSTLLDVELTLLSDPVVELLRVRS